MSEQSLLKIVKRWRRYELRSDWSGIPPKTRGFYVLYNAVSYGGKMNEAHRARR